jgi:hypothetical protein
MTVKSQPAAAARRPEASAPPDKRRPGAKQPPRPDRLGRLQQVQRPGPRFSGKDVRSRLRRADDDRERERLAAPSGGPLAHQRALAPDSAAVAKATVDAPPKVSAVADRILTGMNAAGKPTARLELNLGDWAGVDVDLVAGSRGIEVNVFTATAAARRAIQAQLAELTDELARRGLLARKIGVSVRRRDNRGGSRQDDRR